MGIGEFGPQYKGYEAEAAVDKLLKEKQGEVLSAMKDTRLGDNPYIDFIWGNDTGKGVKGFSHILQKHGEEAAHLVPKIIREGSLILESESMAKYESPDGRVLVRRDWDKKPKNWVLTSYLPNAAKDPNPVRDVRIDRQNVGESFSSPSQGLSDSSISPDNDLHKKQTTNGDFGDSDMNKKLTSIDHIFKALV